jgi:hypothetical protein
MNIVYDNALRNIAASDASDSSEGLFQSCTMKLIELTYERDRIEPHFTVIVQPTLSIPFMKGL